MNRFQNILVVVDTRMENPPIIQRAISLAKRTGASVKLVDVVPDFPLPVRLLLKDHEEVFDLIKKEKLEKLDQHVKDIRAEGLQVEGKVLSGTASVAIIREVMSCQHDLVMRTVKGFDSRRPGFFGNTAFRLLRKCPCAVWLVEPQAKVCFKHILGCVDISMNDPRDDELNRIIYRLTDSLGQYENAKVSLVHAWSIWNEKMIRSRIGPEALEKIRTKTKTKRSEAFFKFLDEQKGGITAEDIHLLAGGPHLVIPEFAVRNNVDLVVMGTVARSGLQGMIMGNTAELILNHLQCSVLALKPSYFVSPINET